MTADDEGASAMEQSTASRTGTTGAGGADGGDTPLQTSKGSTTIADSVVTKVAGIAAREVPGVHDMGGGAARAFGGVGRTVGLGDERSQGVTVEVGEEEAAVDLVVVVDYGESIPDVSQQIRENVSKRIEGITGLRVTEVNVAVTDLYFPGDDQPDEQQQG